MTTSCQPAPGNQWTVHLHHQPARLYRDPIQAIPAVPPQAFPYSTPCHLHPARSPCTHQVSRPVSAGTPPALRAPVISTCHALRQVFHAASVNTRVACAWCTPGSLRLPRKACAFQQLSGECACLATAVTRRRCLHHPWTTVFPGHKTRVSRAS